MKFSEKVELINKFLNNIGDRPSTIPEVIENKKIPTPENKEKFKIIEGELIRNNLVVVITEPNSNDTLGGWGRFRISPKGFELIRANKSVASIFPEEFQANQIIILLNMIQSFEGEISIQQLSRDLEEEVYKIRKTIESLGDLGFVEIRRTVSKDEPNGLMVKLTDKGHYVRKNIENLKEELNELKRNVNQTNVFQENFINSIVNKGDSLSIDSSKIDWSENYKLNNKEVSPDSPTKKNQNRLIAIGIISLILALIGLGLKYWEFI
jgi:hypothetical protein